MKARLSWAFYDWANSAFATVVIAGFFPVFFKEYWNDGVAVTESTFRLGLINSLASLAIVLLAPFLGALADTTSRRKGMLIAFAFLGVVMTAGLYFVGHGEWQLAAVLYALALVGFSGSNIFYDSLLTFISDASDVDRTSALGFSLGYLGGGILLGLNVLVLNNAAALGFADTATVVHMSFLVVALWWAVFSLPLVFNVEEPGTRSFLPTGSLFVNSFRQVFETLRHVRELRPVWMFLVAYWLYIDGVDTVIRMAVDYGLSLGFNQSDLITALLLTQFVGFPAALAFGWLGQRIGPKRGILLGLGIYVFVTARASVMETAGEFYFLAFMIGLAQGGVQALSRSMYARLIPQERSAEFFGFYNMLGKFAAIVGPLLMAWVGLVSGSPRVGILSLLVLFGAGVFTLMFVEHTEVRIKSI